MEILSLFLIVCQLLSSGLIACQLQLGLKQGFSWPTSTCIWTCTVGKVFLFYFKELSNSWFSRILSAGYVKHLHKSNNVVRIIHCQEVRMSAYAADLKSKSTWSNGSCAEKMHLLRSLSFSYQKKGWRAGHHHSFFWYYTIFRFVFCNFPGSYQKRDCQSFFWYDNDKDLKRHIFWGFWLK